MKKSLRLSLLTMAAMLVSGSASADNLPTRSLIYDVPDGEANLFGYLAYDTKYRTFGFVNLQSQNPGAYSLTKRLRQRRRPDALAPGRHLRRRRVHRL